MIEVLALPGDGEKTTWEVRRDGRALGTAVTGVRRSGPLLTGLDVPQDAAADVLDALLDAVRGRGVESLIVDVVPGDAVLEAALHGRDARLVATQMLLDLAAPVSPPERVVLRPMTPRSSRATASTSSRRTPRTCSTRERSPTWPPRSRPRSSRRWTCCPTASTPPGSTSGRRTTARHVTRRSSASSGSAVEAERRTSTTSRSVRSSAGAVTVARCSTPAPWRPSSSGRGRSG